ncbi:hypothetical protein D5S19_18890 [Amycolatopsis panacis]|uniref:Uncharacterized protein n=1 Tax=Amycolatopsis panacis TaxID=2340917 RepID=A0A419I251_9PSEU|nr:hypothetical protein D5S19_18890 [Amycolatopsis panacis]
MHREGESAQLRGDIGRNERPGDMRQLETGTEAPTEAMVIARVFELEMDQRGGGPFQFPGNAGGLHVAQARVRAGQADQAVVQSIVGLAKGERAHRDHRGESAVQGVAHRDAAQFERSERIVGHRNQEHAVADAETVLISLTNSCACAGSANLSSSSIAITMPEISLARISVVAVCRRKPRS